MRKPEQTAGARRWTQWKEPQARAVLGEWRRSGLSAAAFARSRGLSTMRLWYWSKRLGVTTAGRDQAVDFVAVTLPSSNNSRQIELEHAGVRVRVREDLEVEHVARLAMALAEAGRRC